MNNPLTPFSKGESEVTAQAEACGYYHNTVSWPDKPEQTESLDSPIKSANDGQPALTYSVPFLTRCDSPCYNAKK
jgi:hypothetical protein